MNPSTAPVRQAWHSWPRLRWLAGHSLLLLALFGCDPDGKRQCAWVLEPESKLDGTAQPGFIPTCARNRQTMKEDCRLQATLEYAQKVYGQKFRYVDLQLAKEGLPRTVEGIKFCDDKR